MPTSAEIILWRAPSPACPDPINEMTDGFDPQHYPGLGVFFAAEKRMAESFQRCYGRGLQEIHLAKSDFDLMIAQQIFVPDGYYAEGESWSVPQTGLPTFNQALRKVQASRYYPEGLEASS